MKAATGNYKGVRAITQAEAEALAPVIFADELYRQRGELYRQWGELDRQRGELYRQRDELDRQGDELDRQRDELDRQRDELDRQWGELDRQWGELDRQWGELDRQRGELYRQRGELYRQWTAKHQGYSPDWRAINFIAADRPDAVYSFVICTTRNRHEVWVYDGENCPDANTVEVIWVEKGL